MAEPEQHQQIKQHSTTSQLTRGLIISNLVLVLILLLSYILDSMRPCSLSSCLSLGHEELDSRWENKTMIVSCRVVSLRPRWFGLFGKPVPITSCAPSSCPDHQTTNDKPDIPPLPDSDLCHCPDCSSLSSASSPSLETGTFDDWESSGSGHAIRIVSQYATEDTAFQMLDDWMRSSESGRLVKMTSEHVTEDETLQMLEGWMKGGESGRVVKMMSEYTTEDTIPLKGGEGHVVEITSEHATEDTAVGTSNSTTEDIAIDEIADQKSVEYWVEHSELELVDDIKTKLAAEDKNVTVETVKEALTSLVPPPPPLGTLTGYNSWLDKPKPTEIHDYLRIYKVVFIVDDSGSMKGERWTETRDALSTIAEYALELNVHTVSLRFLNNNSDVRGLQGKDVLISWFDKVKPKGLTPLGAALKAVFNEHLDRIDTAVQKGEDDYSKIPPLDIIVLTDGVPTDHGADEPAQVIANAVKRLNDSHYHPNTMGVQIVQIANAEKAKKVLKDLVVGDNGRIVDTVPYAGVVDDQKLLRILLGGVHPNIRSLLPVAMLAN